jgi:hypothetical protein
VLFALAAGVLVAAGIGSAEHGGKSSHGSRPAPNPPNAIKHDTSPPLKTIASKPRQGKKEHDEHKLPVPKGSGTPDPVVQSTQPRTAAPSLGVGFDGIAAVDSLPPDPNGAVGPNHYVQIVNESFQVFSKTGTSVYGPVTTNTLFTGFGGGCENNDDGDATVVYDRVANRWVISQFSVTTTPYLQCVAVSKTGDPTGQYYRYAFQYADFPDYPKLGVWPDAYYITFNLFDDFGFLGPEVCAYNRARMLTGQSATQQCFILDSAYGGLLPSDLDGSTAPPGGAPNYLLNFDTNKLNLWKFHVDWTAPASSTLTGPTAIPVASFTPACDGGACVAQKNVGQQLDSLADRLMYRLAYRNFGDHESLVVTHAVKANGTSGIRWYELRSPGGTPTVYQQGTYAPDSSYRWMSSAAMDGDGDIALGYSISSSSMFPGLKYTARLAGDTLGTMTQGEGNLVTGGGSQTTYERWGDYSSMSIDPADDCTFWYTGEYLPNNGSFNWRTRIGSFKLPSCTGSGGGGGGSGNDFSLSPSPGSLSIAQGGSDTTTIGTSVTSGSAETVSLSASGQPTGTTVSFSPSSVTAGGSSTMTVDVGSSTPLGPFTITVVGTSTSATETTSVNLTVTGVQAVTNGGFETGTLSGWTTGGGLAPKVVTGGKARGGSYSAQLGSTTPYNGNSTLTQTVNVPGGSSSLTFWYLPKCKGKIARDQIQMQIRSTGGSTLATVLNVCSNSSTWKSVTYDTSAFAGQTVVLWFNDHDDGRKGEPTYFLLDDVALGNGGALGSNGVSNPGFEAGNLSSWTAGGALAPTISTSKHTGSYAARIGSPSEFTGKSTLTQTVVVPGGNRTLTFWYAPFCTDTITYDQIQAQIRSGSGQILGVVLNECSNSGTWTKVTYDMTSYAGQSVVLYFNVNDDGYPEDPTYALIDDVALS